MAENKPHTDNHERLRVAGGEDYEVAYLVVEEGIPPETARELIRRYGNNRENLLRYAKKLRQRWMKSKAIYAPGIVETRRFNIVRNDRFPETAPNSGPTAKPNGG